jgi:hypothetical protein
MQQQNKSNEQSKSQTNLSQLKSKLNELPLSERIKVLEVEGKQEVMKAHREQILLLMKTFDLEFSHWVKFNLKTNETIKEGVSNPITMEQVKEKLK